MSTEVDQKGDSKVLAAAEMARVVQVAEAAEPTANSAADFNLGHLKSSFEGCVNESGEILLKNYVEGYGELYKFLNLLGTVFGWVSSDVEAKLQVVRNLMAGPDGSEYVTIQSMIRHEVAKDMVKRKAKDCSTGTRNLLRLHRALEYIIAFLEGVPKLAHEDKCVYLSQEAYKKTLMKHHAWVVQKAASLAMHMLPTKQGLIEKICGSAEVDSEEYRLTDTDQLPNGVKVMQQVYNITQEVYSKYDLLDLP